MRNRRSAYRRKQPDERILEHLESEGWATLGNMTDIKGLTTSEGHIWEQCQILFYIAFIAPVHSDMCELTTDGQPYISSKIDAEHRRRPTVDRVLRGRG